MDARHSVNSELSTSTGSRGDLVDSGPAVERANTVSNDNMRKSKKKKKKFKNKTQYFTKREGQDHGVESASTGRQPNSHEQAPSPNIQNPPVISHQQQHGTSIPVHEREDNGAIREHTGDVSHGDEGSNLSLEALSVEDISGRTVNSASGVKHSNGNSKHDKPPSVLEPSRQGTISPRKQTILRYKKSDVQLDNTSYFQQAKENLKAKSNHQKPGATKPAAVKSDDLDLDEKVTLFKYKSAKILVFDEQLDENSRSSPSSTSSGRLLSHGVLEIFQLHNGDVAYLSCGQTFIYPLLPKVKILRINFNQFILPLQYPERYWKIFLNSDEPHVMDVCQNTFSRLVKYSNLFNPDTSINVTPKKTPVSNNQTKLIRDFAIGAELPPSPPSAPISPHNDMLNHFLNHKISNESLSTDLACLDTKYNRPEPEMKLQQPRPKRIPHRKIPSEKSDSSMDSLLDEYEENITYSKYQSKMHSKQGSVVSHKNPNLEDFPTTSLSEYNRSHNGYNSYNTNHNSSQYNYNGYRIPNGNIDGKNSVRSRKSSISDLYAPETGWMEPSRLTKSRSTYSIASCPNPELNSTYKSIYRSITQRNLRQYTDDELSVKSQRLPSVPARQPNFVRNPRVNQPTLDNRPIDVKLDSSEIFRLISTNKRNQKKAPPPTTRGITSRLFGW